MKSLTVQYLDYLEQLIPLYNYWQFIWFFATVDSYYSFYKMIICDNVMKMNADFRTGGEVKV